MADCVFAHKPEVSVTTSPPATEVTGQIKDSERDRKLNLIRRLTTCVEILLLAVVWGFC